jgi:hypothetical protein
MRDGSLQVMEEADFFHWGLRMVVKGLHEGGIVDAVGDYM